MYPVKQVAHAALPVDAAYVPIAHISHPDVSATVTAPPYPTSHTEQLLVLVEPVLGVE